MSAVKEYYEDLWQRLPDQLAPPDIELRAGFLLSHVTDGQEIQAGDALANLDVLRGASRVGAAFCAGFAGCGHDRAGT